MPVYIRSDDSFFPLYVDRFSDAFAMTGRKALAPPASEIQKLKGG